MSEQNIVMALTAFGVVGAFQVGCALGYLITTIIMMGVAY